MNSFWNSTTQKGFNVTQDDYNKLYDASVDGTMGNTIKAMYGEMAVFYQCAAKDKCTVEELFMNQFLTGQVSLTRPSAYANNSFMGNATPSVCITTTWAMWGVNPYY